MNNGEIAQKTLDIINLMELKDCCDVVITEPGKTDGGLSGGQLRRIAIAVVLLQMPSIICLDEPTSGLDSENALEVIRVLSKLAANGHTVICTIHQPRLEVYQLFTQVIVLTKNGILYHGSPIEANQYLEENCTERFDRASNPADSLILLASKLSKHSLTSFKSIEINTSFKSIEINDFSSVGTTEPTLVDDGEFTECEKTLPTIYEISGSDSSMSSSPSVIQLYFDNDDSLSSIDCTDSNGQANLAHTNITESSLDEGVKSIRGSNLYPDKTAHSENKRKEIGMVEKYFSHIITLNARWWNLRPFSRKIMMLIICIISTIILGVMHRRPGGDLISFELQAKGLLLGIIEYLTNIACIGLPAIKNIAISYDFFLNKELYEFDLRNGRSSHLGFFIHRV
jgi:ABC-type multidrug transport system ATPase subunit